MSMVAIFACNTCNSEQEHGRYKGGAMYQANAYCATCDGRRNLRFVRYESERVTDGGRRTTNNQQLSSRSTDGSRRTTGNNQQSELQNQEPYQLRARRFDENSNPNRASRNKYTRNATSGSNCADGK